MIDDTITRRGFLGAMGAAGAMGIAATLGTKQADAETTMDWDADRKPVSGELTNEQLDQMVLDQTMVTSDYTTSEGKVIPAAFINLRNKLNRIGMGLGSDIEENPRAWDFLMYNMSEEEALQLLDVPLFEEFLPRDYAYRTGRTVEEAQEILENLCQKSFLYEHIHGGSTYYDLAPVEFGWFEGRIPTADVEFVESHDALFGPGFAGQISMLSQPFFFVGPCDPEKVEGPMVPYTNWEDAVRAHETIVAMPCACRTCGDIVGTRSPENQEQYRTNTCIWMGDLAQLCIDRGVGEQLTQEEAIANIKDGVDSGLVTEWIADRDQTFMCQCDREQCIVINLYKALDMQGELFKHVSPYELLYDKEKCIQCGLCIDRCPFDAITVGEDGFMVMDYHCLRCGQCAHICPGDARRLRAIDGEQPVWPNSYLDKCRTVARIRMANGGIWDFLGDEAGQE